MVELLMESPALLFGPAVGLLVVLLLLLWLMGRRRKSVPSADLSAQNENDDSAAEGAVSVEPSVADESDKQDAMGAFTIIRRDDEADDEASTETASEDISTASQKSDNSEWQTISEAAIANAERLAAIEQEMLAVRDLYHQNKIDKFVYVAETRTLFEEAKALTSD